MTQFVQSIPKPLNWGRGLVYLLQQVFLLSLVVLTFSILAYRRDVAPDIHLDEILYYQAAFNLVTTGELTWSGNPILVHPPVYFVAQGILLYLLGMTEIFEPFTGVQTMRLVNASAGAATALFLFKLAQRLGGIWVASLASVLYIFDPFIIRINRRNMLETLSEFWIVFGIYLYWEHRDRLTRPKILLLGFVFGLALLTKELMVFGLAVLPFFVILSRRWQDIKKVFYICSIAVGIWSLFPLWMIVIGYGRDFFANKTYNITRLIGLLQTTGWNRADVSFADALWINLPQYGTSYSLILVGAALVALLFIMRRDERDNLIVAWTGMMYLFATFIVLQGTLNEYFFYYLLVPVVILVGMMIVRIYHWLGPRRGLLQDLLIAVVVLGLLFQSYNIYRWVSLFGVGEDNSLYELAQYIEENIPPGSTINSMFPSGQITLNVMLAGYEIVTLRNPAEIQQLQVEYALLSSKNVWGDYGISSEYNEWVKLNSELLFSTRGNTFWDVSLYRIHLSPEDY